MSTPGGGFSLGITGNTNPTTMSSGLTTNTGLQGTGFGGFSSGSFTPTSSTGFSVNPTVSSASTATPTLNFSATSAGTSTPATTTSSTTFNLPLPTSNAGKSVTFAFTPSNTTTATATKSTTLPITTNPAASTSSTTTSSSDSTDKPINYLQLGELTQKYIADFGDLQKTLMNQTAEIVNRDIILTANHDKIEKFVNSIRNLKAEQTQVDQQLDFILSQQKDLEECLCSLEEEVSSYFPDLPADDMYKLAENIDSRLKKTLETSKEIINKINDKNRSSENITNPMVAIGRILNHHTNSIHMLENTTTEAQTKLNDLLKLYQQYA